jgi:deoxyhypusine monooxygenase
MIEGVDVIGLLRRYVGGEGNRSHKQSASGDATPETTSSTAEAQDAQPQPSESVSRSPLEETCYLALRALEERENSQNPKSKSVSICACQFQSHDPAHGVEGATVDDIPRYEGELKDGGLNLYDRYVAMFTLRNLAGVLEGGEGEEQNENEEKEHQNGEGDADSAKQAAGKLAAVHALASTLDTDTSSPVLRHEIAFVLGQIESPQAVDALIRNLQNGNDHPMVRHETAIALGTIGSEKAKEALREYSDPVAAGGEALVYESCAVALDTIAYWESWEEFERRMNEAGSDEE